MRKQDFKPKTLDEAIEIAKEILLADHLVDLHADWTKEELKLMNLPTGQLQDAMKILHSSKNDVFNDVRICEDTGNWQVWQHQDIGIAVYSHVLEIDNELNIFWWTLKKLHKSTTSIGR